MSVWLSVSVYICTGRHEYVIAHVWSLEDKISEGHFSLSTVGSGGSNSDLKVSKARDFPCY